MGLSTIKKKIKSPYIATIYFWLITNINVQRWDSWSYIKISIPTSNGQLTGVRVFKCIISPYSLSNDVWKFLRIICLQIIYLPIWYSMVMEPNKQQSVKMNEVEFLVPLYWKRGQNEDCSSRMWHHAVWCTGILKIVQEYFCRRLARIFQVTLSHVPEDYSLHSHHLEILKFQRNHNFYY